MTTATLPPAGQPGPPEQAGTKEEQPYVEPGQKRHAGLKLLGILGSGLSACPSCHGQNTRLLGSRTRRGCTESSTRPATGCSSRARTTGSSAASSAPIGDSLDAFVVMLQG